MLDMLAVLESVPDPRDPKKIHHPLTNLLFMSLCSVCSGADTWEDMVTWCELNQDWLKKYIDLTAGIPSYSTFRRLFSLIPPEHFQTLLREMIQMHHPSLSTEDQIAIDGKTLRGSRCQSKHIKPIQMVSAWSVANQLTLAEQVTESKTSELRTIPLLLSQLNIEGTTITVDAIGCHNSVVDAILAGKAHYVIGLKKNQPKLFQQVEAFAHEYTTQLEHLIKDGFDDLHGRLVRRRYFACQLPEAICLSGPTAMQTLIAVETISNQGSSRKAVAHWRYYITDLPASGGPVLANYIRSHWQIESYHWLLDVHLNDDHDKKYTENAAENFARIKRLLLNILKSKPVQGKRISIRSRLKRIAWDKDYLVDVLFS